MAIQGGTMNIEILKCAQKQIEKMAQGINPLSGEVIKSDDLLNNVRISRCLFYVNDILKQVIDNGGIKQNKNKTISFSLTKDELNKYEFNEELPLSKIVKKINELKTNMDMKDLKLKDVYSWLICIWVLEIVNINGRNYKRPTDVGKNMGISVRRIYNNYESYDLVIYDISMQKYIIDNFYSMLDYINNI